MKFSIVTPSYNQVQFIQRALDSVLMQQSIELEYFVFDGGSQDGSVQIIKQYNDSLTYWESKPDKGQCAAINKGFMRSTGDILAYLNSDDIYTPDALSYIATIFEKHPEVDVIYGDCGYIDENDVLFRIKQAPCFSKKILFKKDFIFQPSVFFRRHVYQLIGPMDERYHYCMDYEYWLRMAKNDAIFFHAPRVLSHMRFHNEAKSVAAIPKALNEEKMMKLEYGQDWMETQINYLYKKYIGRYLWPLKRKIAYWVYLLKTRSENG